MSLIGWHYAAGPAGGPADAQYTVVDDQSPYLGCVTVEGPAGDRFSVAGSLILQIAAPEGMTYNQALRQFVPLGA